MFKYYYASDAVVVLSCEGFELASFSYEKCGGEAAAKEAAGDFVELLIGEDEWLAGEKLELVS